MDFLEAVAQATSEMGLDDLKENHMVAIAAFLSGKDVGCLPTGYVTSVIYGTLPLIYDKKIGKLYKTNYFMV